MQLILFLVFFTWTLQANELHDLLNDLDSDDQNSEVIRQHISNINSYLVRQSYIGKEKIEWWKSPDPALINKLKDIATTLEPFEAMLLSMVEYDGIKRGHPSTLTTLRYARPSEYLKDSLEDYALTGGGNGIRSKAAMVIFELGLDDEIFNRHFFGKIENQPYSSEDFYSLKSFSTLKTTNEYFIEALKAQIKNRISGLSESQNDVIEIAVIAQSYSTMVDGMGSGASEVIPTLKELLATIKSSEYEDEVLRVFPRLFDRVNSIIDRISNDIVRSVPPLGYGLVILNQGQSVIINDIPIGEENKASENVTHPKEQVIRAEGNLGEEVVRQAANGFSKWLLLVGLLVLLIFSLILRNRKLK